MTSPLIISIKSTKLTASEKNNLNIFKPYGVILFSRNILNFKQINHYYVGNEKILIVENRN